MDGNNKILVIIADKDSTSISVSFLSGDGDLVFSNVTFDQHQIHSAATPCSDFYFRSLPLKSLDVVVEPQPNPALIPMENHRTIKPPDFQGLDKAVHVGLTMIVLWKVCETRVWLVCNNQYPLEYFK